MWMEWLGRTLGAHSAEDYAGRRARRSGDGRRSAAEFAAATGASAMVRKQDPAVLCAAQCLTPTRDDAGGVKCAASVGARD